MSRVFDVDGKPMVFSFQAFDRIFKTYRQKEKLMVAVLEKQLSEKVQVSADTVVNWRKKRNGPIDLETVKRIASALEIKDYQLLLTEPDGGRKMMQLTDRQKTAAKKIYDKCIWFLSEFDRTDGFHLPIKLVETFGIGADVIKSLLINAANASFAEEPTKQKMIRKINENFK